MSEPPVSEPVAGTLTSDAIDVAAADSGRLSARRFAGDAAWVLGAQILGVICAIGSLRVWAVYLTPAELGFMALVITFASILVGILSGPLMQVVTVCFAGHQARGQEAVFRGETTRFLRRCALAVGALTILLLPAARWFGLDPLACLAIIPLFAIDAFREYERVMFSCVGRQRMVSIVTALDVSTRLACMWAMLAFIDGTARVAILANVVGGGLALLAVLILSRRVAFPGRPAPDPAARDEIAGEIRTIAYPLVPSAIFVNLTEMSSRYVIGASISLSAAGLFVMAYGLVKRPYGMVRDVGALIMMPLLSRRIAERETGEARRIRLQWLGGMAAVCTLGGLLFWGLRDLIVAVLMTADYAGPVRALLPVMALGIGLFTVASVLDDFLLCERRSQTVLVNRTCAFVVSTGLLVLLSASHGLTGAAWSLVGGGIVHLLIASVNVMRVGSEDGRGDRATNS